MVTIFVAPINKEIMELELKEGKALRYFPKEKLPKLKITPFLKEAILHYFFGDKKKKVRIIEGKKLIIGYPTKLLCNYSIGDIQRTLLFPNGAINQTMLIKTNKGRFVLRIFPTKRPKKWIQHDLALLHCLSFQGLPVQQIIPSNQGKRLSTRNQQRYCLLGFVSGKHVFRPSLQQTKSLAKTISQLHQAMQKCRLPRIAKEKDLFDFSYDQQIIKKLKKQKKPLFEPFKEEAQTIQKKLKKIDKHHLQKGLIHHDLAPYNILFQGKNVSAILDFDESCKGHLISDLAVLLGHFPPKTEETFLKEYQKTIRLSSTEQKCLPLLKRHYRLYLGYWLWKQQNKPRPDRKKIRLYQKFFHQYQFKSPGQKWLEKALSQSKKKHSNKKEGKQWK